MSAPSVEASTDLLAARLPEGFLLGAATAAYQIEGATSEGGRRPSIWDTFSHTPGRTVNGETGDVACDHYHRWPGDIALMNDLSLKAYRFSVSWARLQPDGTGRLNVQAVEHYRNVLGALADRGIRPFVTLYHWDLPQTLEDRGGWPVRETAERFADYAGQVVAELGDLATDWVTLNEPWCSSFLGYGTGKHAPGRTSIPDAVAAAHHLNLAHGLALRAIRERRPEASVGVTHLLTDVHPATADRADVAAAGRVDGNNNRLFLDPLLRGGYPAAAHDLYDHLGLRDVVRRGDLAVVAQPGDFVGVNHYHQVVVRHDADGGHLRAREEQAEPRVTSLGWSLRPESLANVLLRVGTQYTSLPLYVTENGASLDDAVVDGEIVDPERQRYLTSYLGAVADAVDLGVDVRGYFAWSLLDNFEWAEGYRPRFGLVHVDYATQQRTPKASAWWYRDLIDAHARAVLADRPGQRRS